ncbi:uncharacterized protein LOC131634387 [Vicia villosa]|uniref:uncharacterized protein LOC131634387 n=1 Tax=Vicia villosa TaxID=3911 RepID=UPI00273B2678|nr:uncharacterized protein LOC131634387 [Vicia villosa]
MAQALEHQPNVRENAASRNLTTFQRDNSHVFKGNHDSDGRLFRGWRLMEKRSLELRKWNKSVMEYAAKFGELAKFYQHYDGSTGEFSKCNKFENGLRPKIKKTISYQKIRVFADLVDSFRIYEEDNNAHYQVISEKWGKSQQDRGKPYDAPVGKGKQKAIEYKITSGGDAPAGITCFKCGKVGHKSTVCTADAMRCYRCGEIGHMTPACKHKQMVCFNCGEEGHIGSKCRKPKKEQTSG